MIDKDGSKQPAPEGFQSWSAYWHAQGMPWRRQPEIDEERRHYLAERRAVAPNAGKGIYPFRGIRLHRADVEWLLATHVDTRGRTGPVEWQDERQWRYDSLDLRGADLSGTDLSHLPLTRLLGSLRNDEWLRATPEAREQSTLHLERANLEEAHFEGANLRGAHLELANLKDAHLHSARMADAHLEGTNLTYAHLEQVRLNHSHLGGKRLSPAEVEDMRHRMSDFPAVIPPANLRFAYFDSLTSFDGLDLGSSSRDGWANLENVHWNGANVTSVEWGQVHMVGEEWQLRHHTSRRSRADVTEQYRAAVRANRQVATLLREQGLNEEADRFAYRAQALQRTVLLRQRRGLRWFGSWLLDLISGYGYKPIRSIITYLLVILSFAAAFFALTNLALTPFLPSHSSPLAWYEAIVLSVSSFHGRGLFPSGLSLGDPIAILAALEAIIGLLIEITFIATFTQRFFAR